MRDMHSRGMRSHQLRSQLRHFIHRNVHPDRTNIALIARERLYRDLDRSLLRESYNPASNRAVPLVIHSSGNTFLPIDYCFDRRRLPADAHAHVHMRVRSPPIAEKRRILPRCIMLLYLRDASSITLANGRGSIFLPLAERFRKEIREKSRGFDVSRSATRIVVRESERQLPFCSMPRNDSDCSDLEEAKPNRFTYDRDAEPSSNDFSISRLIRRIYEPGLFGLFIPRLQGLRGRSVLAVRNLASASGRGVLIAAPRMELHSRQLDFYGANLPCCAGERFVHRVIESSGWPFKGGGNIFGFVSHQLPPPARPFSADAE